MIRFLAFISVMVLTEGIGNPLAEALAVLAATLTFVGFKPFVDMSTNESSDRVIVRNKSYFRWLVIAPLVIALFSFPIYLSPKNNFPEALDPPDSLRIGDTNYFERSFSFEEVEEALKIVKSKAHITGESTTDLSGFTSFFFILTILYLLLITKNIHWHNSRGFSLFVILVVLAGVNLSKFYYFDNEKAMSFQNASPESVLKNLYPIAMEDCEASYSVETSGTISKEYQWGKDNKEWQYNPGFDYETTLGSNDIKYCRLDWYEDYSTSKQAACDTVKTCVSAVYFLNQKNKNYKLLSFEQAVEIL